MSKGARVLIIEDDPYARDLMALLLTRDWRTRVVGEAGAEAEALHILNQPSRREDLILLDTEIPGDPEWPFRVAEAARSGVRPPVILCTGTRADVETLRRILRAAFGGYILKTEVSYALAWAVTRAAAGHWVTTPGIWQMAHDRRLALPQGTVVLDGRGPTANFTRREDELARLAVLFNLAQRDLADELHITADQISKVVSSVYTKIGLREILSGEVAPEVYFEDKAVLAQFERVLKHATAKRQRAGRAHKAPDMATLAFHLLTVPTVE